MTPATVAHLVIERANELAAAQSRGELAAAPTIEMLLAHAPVADGIGCCSRFPGQQVVVLLALAAGQSVIGLWRCAFPDLSGPPEALIAAEDWAKEPSEVAADVAARAADRAIRECLSVWHGRDRAAAWAGRVAAWVAMAPKYGWPAVAALNGACEAAGSESVVGAVSACLLDLPRRARAAQ